MAAPPYRVERKSIMTTNEIMSTITSSFSSFTFYQIGNGEYVYTDGSKTEDGVTIYNSIKFGTKATKDTKTHKAFNLSEAIEKYEEQKLKAVERANKPKGSKKAEPTAEQAALVCEVREALSASLEGLNAQDIASIVNAGREEEKEVSWQKVSSILKKFASDGTCTTGEKDGKRIYILVTNE